MGENNVENPERLRLLTQALPQWYADHARALPWRQDREPYHIWLSEIMLQQTRVEAVRGYYARFLAALPDIPALAQADPELLHKLWEGLGYYARVRNLQKAAQVLLTKHEGHFPEDYAAIRSLPGIGDYTAGAICSICFDLPTPAVDGNVLRVVTRLTADGRCVDDPAVKRDLRETLAAVYPARGAGVLTQALMELGATVCVPNGAPNCGNCPAAAFCAARDGDAWASYPVRAKKRERRIEQRTVFVFSREGALALKKRKSTGLLAGLWEFPNVPGWLEPQQALNLATEWGLHPRGLERQTERTHIFTHVQWEMRCYYIPCAAEGKELLWADEPALNGQYALPTAFRMFRPGQAGDEA
ncbi:MAG: A/G-specific adenine glycosylase [Oscillospiraceae bacterium]|nr:A/G-specific adenine glycosylase [Oscillospiraceae bacterium]